MRQGDLLPPLRAVLTDATGAPIDLTDATVTLRMWLRGGTTLQINSAATVENGAGGAVLYDWLEGDTDTPGAYEGMFDVVIDGKRLTAPNQGTFEFHIIPRVGD